MGLDATTIVIWIAAFTGAVVGVYVGEILSIAAIERRAEAERRASWKAYLAARRKAELRPPLSTEKGEARLPATGTASPGRSVL